MFGVTGLVFNFDGHWSSICAFFCYGLVLLPRQSVTYVFLKKNALHFGAGCHKSGFVACEISFIKSLGNHA